MEKNNSWGKILAYGGSYFGAVVGAGFASGQEVMQFYTNYGAMSIFAIIPATVLFIWLGIRFGELGNRLHTNTHGPVMQYLCGKYAGKIFDYILLFFMFGGFSIMVSGGGTTLATYFGVNPYLGRVIMAVASILAVSFGLAFTLKIGGLIGPLIVVFSLLVAVIGLVTGGSSIAEADAAIENANLVTSAPNVWVSVFIYVSYCVMPNCPMLISIGNNEQSKSNRTKGLAFGAVLLGVCLSFINGALLRNYAVVGDSEIPMVEIARSISKPLGYAYAIILFAAIFTTAISALYGIVCKLPEAERKKRFIVALIVSAAAMVLGFVPFSTLVGTLYPVMGYIGLIVMVAILVHQIRDRSRQRIS